MFKREMKINFKSFLTWTIILISLFLVIFLVYPSIINSENIKMMDELMAMFPKEVLKAFNMDITSINTAYGWLKSEGFIFILLITGCYSGILGTNILLKEESDKTIEYLNMLPVKRKDIVLKKTASALIYITLMVLIIGIFNLIGLTISGDLNLKEYLLLSITPIFSSIVIFSLCLFLSTLAHKSKKMLGSTLGIVFASYVLQIISGLGENVKFLKDFSVFTLADTRNVILNTKINPVMIIISIIISVIFIILTLINYERKELV